jgi:hypothetical protein
MKKTIKLLSIILALILFASFLTGCDTEFGRTVAGIFGKSDITYQATTRFLYSQDGGKSWSETIQEVPVNQTYYLAVEMQVAQSEETKEEKTIVCTVTIPYTTVVDCFLDDHPGVSITGKVDAENKSESFEFTLVSGTTPVKFRAVFECKPVEEGRATVTVVYDDNVSESWDASGTIKYVLEDGATDE